MPTAEIVYNEAKMLPPDLIGEVLDFIRFLATKTKPGEANMSGDDTFMALMGIGASRPHAMSGLEEQRKARDEWPD
jgi:hypothetical protein